MLYTLQRLDGWLWDVFSVACAGGCQACVDVGVLWCKVTSLFADEGKYNYTASFITKALDIYCFCKLLLFAVMNLG